MSLAVAGGDNQRAAPPRSRRFAAGRWVRLAAPSAMPSTVPKRACGATRAPPAAQRRGVEHAHDRAAEVLATLAVRRRDGADQRIEAALGLAGVERGEPVHEFPGDADVDAVDEREVDEDALGDDVSGRLAIRAVEPDRRLHRRQRPRPLDLQPNRIETKGRLRPPLRDHPAPRPRRPRLIPQSRRQTTSRRDPSPLNRLASRPLGRQRHRDRTTENRVSRRLSGFPDA